MSPYKKAITVHWISPCGQISLFIESHHGQISSHVCEANLSKSICEFMTILFVSQLLSCLLGGSIFTAILTITSSLTLCFRCLLRCKATSTSHGRNNWQNPHVSVIQIKLKNYNIVKESIFVAYVKIVATKFEEKQNLSGHIHFIYLKLSFCRLLVFSGDSSFLHQ